MPFSPFSQKYSDLPASLPIFPLGGAVVMPTSYLPLNIFETRYLNMITDAMRSNQLIGMIQPRANADAQALEPELYEVGTCGRIVQYEETQDGRFNIVLNGLCRFRIDKEISTTRGYRLVSPEWSEFEQDFSTVGSAQLSEYGQLKVLLKEHIDKNDFDPKWKEVIENVEPRQVVSNAVSYLPFSAEDKQFLVETRDLSDQVSAVIAVMQTSASGQTQH